MNTLADARFAVPTPIEVSHSRRIAPYLAQLSIAALIFVSITAPVINLSESLPWFRVEQLALIPIGLVYLWLVLAGRAGLFRLNPMFIVAFIYSFCILLSLLYGTFVLGHPFLVRNLYEFPKVWLPVAFFTFGLEAKLSESAVRRVLRVLSIGIIPVCLYAWAQWMDLEISYWLVQFYSGGFHDDGALAHYRRVYSTMGNPNLLAQLLTWAIAAFTLALLLKLGNRLVNIVLVLMCLVTLAMTGSRYGLIDTALVLLLILWLSMAVKRRQRAPLILLGTLLPIFAWVTITTATTNRATLDRFQSLRDPLTTDSVHGRLDDLWPDASKEFLASPLFGQGPAKEIFTDVVTDSEYLDVLKQFGIIGFIAYFAIFIYPLRQFWRGLQIRAKSHSSVEVAAPASSWALQFSFIMLVSGLVMNIGMSLFYNAPLQGFFWLWMGIGVSTIRPMAAALGKPSQ